MSQFPSSTPPENVAAPTSDEKTMGMLAHLLALISSFIGPLIIYLVKKDSAYVTAHAKESLNFQITLLIYGIICFLLAFVLIGFLLGPAVGLFGLICVIIATIRANEGVVWRYPITIRLIK